MHPPVKVVVSGPVAAGKTSFVTTLSETDVVNTDEMVTEEGIGKEETTVAMDFGSLVIDDYPIYLFGTPGQERFDFMWEILCEGAVGLVLLVAGDRPKDFAQARRIYDFITSQIAIPTIVGVTRQDMPKVWAPEDVGQFFELPEDKVVGLNALDRKSSFETLFSLFEVINQQAAVQSEA